MSQFTTAPAWPLPARRAAPTVVVVGVAVAAAWITLIVLGGGRDARLGLLTGGAALLSMPGMFAGSGAKAAAHLPSMPGMHMPAVAAAHSGSMTMLGVSVPVDGHVMSWTTLGAFMWMWLVMVAAMMLVAALPATIQAARRRDHVSSRWALAFITGDLAVWVLLGVPAYGLLAGLEELFPAPGTTAVRLGALALAAAGLYEVTSSKRRFRHRCCLLAAVGPGSTARAVVPRSEGEPPTRPPMTARCALHPAIEGAPPAGTAGPARRPAGAAPAWRSGVGHGLASVGCCGPLMGVILLVGMMNLAWMALIAAVMVIERTTPWGPWLSRALSSVLVLVAVALLVSPGHLPALA